MLLPIHIDNLEFIQGDAISLSGIETESIPVLSCLHALEHFGLGRYGDPLDYDGWNKALCSFKRVISTGGLLYLSVPVGICETVMFNAHRIFDPITIVNKLIPEFKLLEFTLLHCGTKSTYIFSHNKSLEKIEKIFSDIKTKSMGTFDCGIYIFQKL
ncbi:MAG: DUF268 domain-containing protein [Lachnospiraceae bacterium]|nr:DUF268 domain-containing protein [Lachnospiraceae bacterium]